MAGMQTALQDTTVRLNSAESGRRRLLYALVVFLVVSALYQGIPTSNFNGDGLGYANVVANADSSRLWSVSARLFYCPSGRAALDLVSALGAETRAANVLSRMNSLFVAIGVAVFFFLSLTLTRSMSISIAVTLGLAGSYAVWFWGTNCTSYPGNVMFLIFTLTSVLFLIRAGSTRRRFVLAALAGLFHALACLYWLTSVILAPAILLAVFVASAGLRMQTRIAVALLYGIVYSLVLNVPLAIAGASTADVGSIGEFVTWLRTASHSIPPELSVGNMMRGTIGFTSSIVLLKYVGPFVKEQLWGVPFVHEGIGTVYSELALFCAVWAVIAIVAILFLRRRKDVLSGFGRIIAVMTIWAAPIVAFGLVWLGTDTERWLALTPILWLFLALLAAGTKESSELSYGKVLTVSAYCLAGFVIVYNLTTFIYPGSQRSNNFYWSSAEQIASKTGERDLVMIWGHDNVFTGSYLDYFYHRDNVHLWMAGSSSGDAIEQRLRSEIAEATGRGGGVFVVGRMFMERDVPESHYSDDNQYPSRRRMGEILSAWERTEAFVVGIDTFWELKMEPNGENGSIKSEPDTVRNTVNPED